MKQSNHPALSEFVQSVGPELMANRRFRNLDVKSTVEDRTPFWSGEPSP